MKVKEEREKVGLKLNIQKLRSWHLVPSLQFSSVAQLCPILCDPMNRSMPGLSVHHQLPEFTQTHVHQVHDAIQPSHPLSSPSPPAPNPSQHQSLFQWVIKSTLTLSVEILSKNLESSAERLVPKKNWAADKPALMVATTKIVITIDKKNFFLFILQDPFHPIPSYVEMPCHNIILNSYE